MGREEFEVLNGGILRRKSKRNMGLFIDGTGLDRATRRIERKVDMSRLVASLTAGATLEVARYYTLVPYEDDARQLAFLDAVSRAGIEVVTKRLPPKGVKRQVSVDVHMATDIVSFCCGVVGSQAENSSRMECREQKVANGKSVEAFASDQKIIPLSNGQNQGNLKNGDSNGESHGLKRVISVLCPSRELTYAIYVAKNLGTETSLVDFGLYGTTDGWVGVDRWVDISSSETIWRS